MNYTIEFETERGYVLVTTSGKASIEGFQQMHRAMLAHPSWKDSLNLLSDHRQPDSQEFSAEDVQRMSLWRADLSRLPKRMRIATVVESDLGFGLMRMWEGLTEGFLPTDRRIFRSMEEAKAWLGNSGGDGREP